MTTNIFYIAFIIFFSKLGAPVINAILWKKHQSSYQTTTTVLQFSVGNQLTAIFLYALMLATEKQIISMTHLLTLRNFLQSAIESNTAFRVENHCFVGLAELIQQHTLQVSSAITQDNKHHVLSCNKHTQRTNHKLHTNLKYCSYHSQFFIDF